MTLEEAVEWCKANEARATWAMDGQVTIVGRRAAADPDVRPVYRVTAVDLPAAAVAAKKYIEDHKDVPFGMPGEVEVAAEYLVEAKASLTMLPRCVGGQDVLIKRNALEALVRWARGA